ncbi:MAG: hypothetical protein IBJ11_03445 [Phycisphaerales bacterium]|nr:hypothetical protein [Phycisphaerales bacterium]
MSRTFPHDVAGGSAHAAAGILRVAVGDHAPGGCDLRIGLSVGGPWSGFLGGWPLPGAGAIELMDEAVSRAMPGLDRIELIGCPSACLLPALWARSIWLPPGVGAIALDWRTIAPPAAGDDAGRQTLAAQLCVRVVDELRCTDPGSAARLWGIGPSVRTASADPSALIEGFQGLIDAWSLSRDRGPRNVESDWRARTKAALDELAKRGVTRVALYGAGTHTRSLGPVLMQPPVQIVAILDDNHFNHGRTMWGYPIRPRSDALSLGVQAVVLSANMHEPTLWEASADLRAAGIEVIRLYTAGGR